MISVPTNPFAANSAEHLDFEIWAAGIDQFNARPYSPSGGTVPHELDYVRGLHRLDTLDAIVAFLKAGTGAAVRASSLWLDKTAYVIPEVAGARRPRRELADIAVVVRRQLAGHVRSDMWLLQAKKLDAPGGALPGNRSTLHEIELLERMPPFDYTRADGTEVRIDLAADFKTARDHWDFLIFKRDPRKFKAGVSPCARRWASSSPSIESFSDALLRMMKTGSPGAQVDRRTPHREWRKLWIELVRYASAVGRNGFAGGRLRSTSAFAALDVAPMTRFSALWEPLFLPLSGEADLRGRQPPIRGELSLVSTGFGERDFGAPGRIEAFLAQARDDLDPGQPDRRGPDGSFEGNGGGDPPESDDGDDGDARPGGGIGLVLLLDAIGTQEERAGPAYR